MFIIFRMRCYRSRKKTFLFHPLQWFHCLFLSSILLTFNLLHFLLFFPSHCFKCHFLSFFPSLFSCILFSFFFPHLLPTFSYLSFFLLTVIFFHFYLLPLFYNFLSFFPAHFLYFSQLALKPFNSSAEAKEKEKSVFCSSFIFCVNPKNCFTLPTLTTLTQANNKFLKHAFKLDHFI